MSLSPTLLKICLLGLAFPLGVSDGLAQTSTSDTAARVASDSQPASRDSLVPRDSSRATSDTAPRQARPDSNPSRDSTRASLDSTRDSTRSAATGSPTPKSATTTSMQPVDSVLRAACGAPGASTVAPDLLVVVFDPAAGAKERVAAAKGVRGTLLGRVAAEPNAFYVRTPTGGGEFGLRAAADQLALEPIVRQVGSRNCP
jgi:hypothetical protein